MVSFQPSVQADPTPFESSPYSIYMPKIYTRMGLLALIGLSAVAMAQTGQQSSQNLPPNSSVPPDMQIYQQIATQTGGSFYYIPNGDPQKIEAAFQDISARTRLERYDEMNLMDIRYFLLRMPLRGTGQQTRALRRQMLRHTDDIIRLAQQRKLRDTTVPMNALIRLIQSSTPQAIAPSDAQFVVGYFMHGARL